MMKKLLLTFITAFIAISFTSCDKDNYGIPLVNVDVIVYTNNPQNIDLSVTGGWIYYPAGSRGLIIYRYSSDEFKAYERHSPYQPDVECDPVYVDNSDIIVKDPCSDSEWVLVDGSVIKGPASLPLKQYQTYFDGSALHIYN